MSTKAEVEAPAVEVPPEDTPMTEEAHKAEKPAKKERKPRVTKEKKPKQPKTASHPPYFQMIKEALLALNEKSGSSPYAIAKYMEEKHETELPTNFKKMLALQLKNSVSKGKLIKIKASYKLSESGKKEEVISKPAKKKTEKKTKEDKTTSFVASRTTRSTKKNEKTKKVTKPAKKIKKSSQAKPKQVKSIKSPAAKKAARKAI